MPPKQNPFNLHMKNEREKHECSITGLNMNQHELLHHSNTEKNIVNGIIRPCVYRV